MNKSPLAMLALASASLALSGCLAYQDPDAPPPATQNDISYLRAEIRQQQNRIAALEQQIDQLNRDIAEARYAQSASAASYASSSQVEALNGQLSALRQQLGAVDSARVKDRDEIMSSVSKTIATAVRQAQPPARPSGGVKATGTHSGVEHVVQSGETLSAIAQAYGVKTSTILEYNDIKNPSMIRVGQTLFIPQ